MAEVEGQEKTEQPTQKKLTESRERGQVAKSMEVNSFAIFTSGLLLLYISQQFISGKISAFSEFIFNSLDVLSLNKEVLSEYALKGYFFFILTLSPLFAGLVVIALAVSIAQVGFKVSVKALAPKMSKFNPVNGLKRIFFSSRSAVEVAKAITKLIVIGVFTYLILKQFIIDSTALIELSIEEILQYMLDTAYSLLWKIGLLFALIAAADFVFQRYKFNKDMMMTKQEVKEEHKQSEGDPQIKARIRRMQMIAARNRMMQNVPKADVIITNPTHYAVALMYNLNKDSAPKVVAKGMDELAQKIKEIGRLHNVPIHEDKELARSLYKHCDVGDQIPVMLFRAVAQILAYVYQLKNHKKKRAIV